MSHSLFQALTRTVFERFTMPASRAQNFRAPATGRYAHLQEGGICPERIAKPGHIPAANGCGAEGGQKYPDKIWGANFSFACTEHDWCYDTCNTTQAGCDNTFCSDLQGACAAAGFDTYFPTNCASIAGAYCLAVKAVGEDAYNAAQGNACVCCGEGETACGDPKYTCCTADQTCCNDQCCDGECCNGQCCPPGQKCCDGVCKTTCEPLLAYCPCNETCYGSVALCTAECPVSLGCFTNICGPAVASQCG